MHCCSSSQFWASITYTDSKTHHHNFTSVNWWYGEFMFYYSFSFKRSKGSRFLLLMNNLNTWMPYIWVCFTCIFNWIQLNSTEFMMRMIFIEFNNKLIMNLAFTASTSTPRCWCVFHSVQYHLVWIMFFILLILFSPST